MKETSRQLSSERRVGLIVRVLLFGQKTFLSHIIFCLCQWQPFLLFLQLLFLLPFQDYTVLPDPFEVYSFLCILCALPLVQIIIRLGYLGGLGLFTSTALSLIVNKQYCDSFWKKGNILKDLWLLTQCGRLSFQVFFLPE